MFDKLIGKAKNMLKAKSMLSDTSAASPLLGIVVLLIGVIVVIAIGSTVLTEINTSTANVSSDFYIADLGTNWTTIVGLVFVAVIALVGFFIIRMFGSGGNE